MSSTLQSAIEILKIHLSNDPVIVLDELKKILLPSQAGALAAKVSEHHSKDNKATRFGLYPPKDLGAFRYAKKMQATYWPSDEISFTQDMNDFINFTVDERNVLISIFAFFAVGDGAISNMLAYQMMLIKPTMSENFFYANQLSNEFVHAEVYGKMIYTLVSNADERQHIFDAVENIQCVKNMSEFIENSFINPSGNRTLYVSMALAEYLMFTPLFCVIFWFRAYKQGKIPNIIFSNTQIARDESLHCQYGCYNYLILPIEERFSDEEIHSFVHKAVVLVEKFSEYLFITQKITLEDLNLQNVNAYIKYVADDLLDRLGHSKAYFVKNPFMWMDYTTLVPKDNFYERTVGEYSRINVNKSMADLENLLHGTRSKNDTISIVTNDDDELYV